MTLAQLPPSIESPIKDFDNNTIVSGLVSRLLTYGIILAGLYFFVRLISGGYTYMTSLGDPAKISAAQQTLVNALIGLIIVVSAYFIAQIIATITGIKILL